MGAALPLLPQQATNSLAEIEGQSAGCVSCHGQTEASSMHSTGTVHIGCSFCHGGDPKVMKPASEAEYSAAKNRAHPKPTVPELWKSSANPERPYTDWLKESEEYIRFVNPGDLRVAEKTCGAANCHVTQVRNVQTSMMTHGGMLWGAALYNNGAVPFKNPQYGESYGPDGKPQRLTTSPVPSAELTRDKGVLPFLDPLQRWEISQPGNILRVFERGGGARVDLGNPNPRAEPGRPDDKLSDRGLGTLVRTDPVFLGLAEDAIARSDSVDAGNQRSRGGLSRQRMHGVPRGVCE